MRVDASGPAATTATAAADKAALRQAAQAFEAIMLKEILRQTVPEGGDARQGLAIEAISNELAPAISSGLAQLLEKQA